MDDTVDASACTSARVRWLVTCAANWEPSASSACAMEAKAARAVRTATAKNLDDFMMVSFKSKNRLYL
ncbi:MAG: hypothetical protein IPG16_17200 [Comamonadaceae bacterium]|nr:hypothetical protein [Comamonadaceae bacterium]